MPELTRAVVEAALQSPDPDDPIAKRCAAHLERLTKLLEAQVQFQGGWPKRLTVPAPKDVVEEVAQDTFVATLRDQGVRLRLTRMK